MAHTINLYMVGTTFYYRCRIPYDLTQWFNGATDYKRSLRTKNPTYAKRLLKFHISRTESTFTMLRSGLLDDAQMHELVNEYINHGLTGRWKDKRLSSVTAIRVNDASAIPSQEITEVTKVNMLSDIVEKYIQEYKDTENVGSTSVYELETKCRLFARVVGDMDIKAVLRDTIIEFLKKLRHLPRNMSKQRKYDGKTIDEVIAMNPVDILSDTTIENYMVRVGSFFSWAHRVGYIDRNPADGIKVGKKKKVRPDEERKAYAHSDLNKLVDAYVEQDEAGALKLAERPERFWLPLISLYSGMRLNEICQLHTVDIEQDEESEIWYFNVDSAEDESKSVKTVAGRRMIPVHPVLISLGFIEFYSSVVASKKPRLWMALTKSVRGYHRNFSYWFLGHNKELGFLRKYVTTDNKLNFHSFRHTFLNALKQKMVNEKLSSEIAGHSNSGETFGRYGKPYELRIKMSALKKLQYPIDLEKLKVLARHTL